MQYPTLPDNTKCINFASSGAYSPFFDLVWSFDYAIVGSSEVQGGFTVFLMENIPLAGGSSGIDLGYSGLSSSVQGISGALIGVGFDSTGLFAASAAIGGNVTRDGINENEAIKDSITIRTGWPDYSYNEDSFTSSISSLISSAFNVVEPTLKYKTIRARLGNLGRTLYIDYRNNINEDFTNILTKNISLYPNISALYKVGVSFATPISSDSYINTGDIYFKNFHVEGSSNNELYSGCSINCDTDNNVCDIDLGILPPDYRCLTLSCVSAAPICEVEPCANTVPRVINFNTVNVEESDSARSYAYLSEGATVGVDTCNLTTCVNTATGIDLFNFGYKLSVIELNTSLFRDNIFSYKNSNNTVTAELTAIGDPWKITSGTNIYIGSSALPIGEFTGVSNLSVIYVQ